MADSLEPDGKDIGLDQSDFDSALEEMQDSDAIFREETGYDKATALAKLNRLPAVQAAITMLDYSNSVYESPTLWDLANELTEQLKQPDSGDMQGHEHRLSAQAITLDSMFHKLARDASMQTSSREHERLLRLSLKAQSQSMVAIEKLSELKNPRHATFVKQANIANGHQQVNNGVKPPQPAPSRTEKAFSDQNELLEAQDGERVDTRATEATSGTHKNLEALGALNRPTEH